jgi:chemotaxis signal transduction protein
METLESVEEIADVHPGGWMPQVATVSEARGPSGTDLLSVFVFRIGSERFGLAVEAVGRVEPAVEIAPLPGAPPPIAGIVNVHGAVLAVLDLRRRFGGAFGEPALDDRLVLAQTPSRQLAILADEVEGVRGIPRESVTDLAPLVAGAGRLRQVAAGADGLIYLYDADRLLSSDEAAELELALARRPA